MCFIVAACEDNVITTRVSLFI